MDSINRIALEAIGRLYFPGYTRPCGPLPGKKETPSWIGDLIRQEAMGGMVIRGPAPLGTRKQTIPSWAQREWD